MQNISFIKLSYRFLKTLVSGIFSFIFFLIFIQIFTVLLFVPLFPDNKKQKLFFKKVLMYYSRFFVFTLFNYKTKVINLNSEKFAKPSVIICNHSSFLDIPLTLMLIPKLIIFINANILISPFYLIIRKYVDFYSVSDGVEDNINILKNKVDEGYSILIFPEGQKNVNNKISRFHKGAFYIAEMLNLDILPVVIYNKLNYKINNWLFFKRGIIKMKILKRISCNDKNYGSDYSKRAKAVGKYFRDEYNSI